MMISCGNVGISRCERDFQVPVETDLWFPQGRHFHSCWDDGRNSRRASDLDSLAIVIPGATGTVEVADPGDRPTPTAPPRPVARMRDLRSAAADHATPA